jgi:hypothetical protein
MYDTIPQGHSDPDRPHRNLDHVYRKLTMGVHVPVTFQIVSSTVFQAFDCIEKARWTLNNTPNADLIMQSWKIGVYGPARSELIATTRTSTAKRDFLKS